MKIAVIGSGNMGGAIARGLAEKGIVPAAQITCTARTRATLDALARDVPGVGVSLDNAAAVAGADWVFLCVKPWLVEAVCGEIRDALPAGAAVASVAAGVSLEELERFLEGSEPARRRSLFRVMPNTAAVCGESVTFVAAGESAPRERLDALCALLGALGETRVVPESKMAGAAALASCGIAFAMRYVRAACEGGVELGFCPDEAREIVLRTLRGAVAVLERSGAHPEAEIDRVTTPGGVTIRGLNAMEAAGFTNAVIAGLRAAAGKTGGR
ncbi:MAG: pyrroline-5-carboxylate reductase [Candidatus Spyradosoma sp.]